LFSDAQRCGESALDALSGIACVALQHPSVPAYTWRGSNKEGSEMEEQARQNLEARIMTRIAAKDPYRCSTMRRRRTTSASVPISMRWYVLLLASLGSMKAVAGNAYTESAKCPFMNYLLDHATSKQGIVLDVGANGGCEMTTALRKGRRVIGVECLESAYRELLNMSHIMENPNATLLHVCASNNTRMAELNLAGDSSSLIEANVAKGWELKKVPKHGRVREPVILLPLDKLLPTAECVAVIKVDVQGAEYEALQGLLNTIIRDRPVIGYEDERRFMKGGNVSHMLERLGYTCHGYGNPHYNREGNTICTPLSPLRVEGIP
jgi:UDP-sugar transporter A1/2/3